LHPAGDCSNGLAGFFGLAALLQKEKILIAFLGSFVI
jgi:hypothetical protein